MITITAEVRGDGMSIELTKEILDERYVFNLETGIVTNRIRTAQRTKVGEEAGCLNLYGYRQICINGRYCLTARVIWFFVKGEWPANIDHINHDRSDNRLINLRSVTNAENSRNRSKSPRNTSGVMGVSWNKAARKWCARIQVNSKQIHLGLFTNMADAITARAAAKVKYGFSQNHA